MSETNGAVNMNAVAEALTDTVTVGYRPVIPLEAMWAAGGNMPQISLNRDIEIMQWHPIVLNSLEFYRAGLSGAQFWGGPDYQNPGNMEGKPISMNPAVAHFVRAHVERFWRHGVPVIQEGGYPYGWAAGEHVYREVGGYMTWSYVKDFHPRDSFMLTHEYAPVGVRVKNIRNKNPIDLWLASGDVPAKACWYAHRPRFNQFYGRSQLIGAWLPWRRLGWRDAVEQVIDAAIYRAGYRGPIVKHPNEDMQTSQPGVPATLPDSRGMPRRSARDVARQIVEWAKAGAGFTIPSTQYAPTQGGGPKWEVEFPEHVMDVRPLIDAAHYLEDQIMLGIGVPPELVKAGGTGSGYSGRSIPREAFLQGQQHVADLMLQNFVDQVVRPLVLWNFGDVPFEISCKSLLMTQADDKHGAMAQDQGIIDYKKSQAAKDTWRRRKISEGIEANETPASTTPQSTAPALSLGHGEQTRDRVLSIVRRVLAA